MDLCFLWKNRSISVVHSKLTGWLFGADGLTRQCAVWSGFCSGDGGETRSTSHKTPSNHLTRLEVNYGVQQINMHKSFREKRGVLCTLAFMSDQVEARECLMWSEQQQSIKQERGWQDGLDIHMWQRSFHKEWAHGDSGGGIRCCETTALYVHHGDPQAERPGGIWGTGSRNTASWLTACSVEWKPGREMK